MPEHIDSPRIIIALIGLIVLALISLVGALYLTANGNDATVAWSTTTGAIGVIGGILIPTRA